MSAPEDNAPEGTPRPREESDATPTADPRPRTLRSPLPPPPQMPGIIPMPELARGDAQAAPPAAPASLPQPHDSMPPAGAALPVESGVAPIASPLDDRSPLPPLSLESDASLLSPRGDRPEIGAPPRPPLAPSGDSPHASVSPRPPLAPQGEGLGVRTPIAGYGQQVERGAWQRRDKVETNDPVEDEEQLHVECGDGWVIVGASRIGRGHLHDGKYREDGLAAAITASGWHLVAVADGGGSYRLARVGAPLAARVAVAAMRTALEEGEGTQRAQRAAEDAERGERLTTEGTEGTEGREGGGRPIADDARGAGDESRARATLVAGMRAARQALDDEAERRRAGGDEALTAAGLRTTLLLALHRTLPDGGQLVAGAQVGDGLIAARAGADGPLHLLGQAETGAVGDETMFLPDVPDEAGDWEGRVRLTRLAGGAGVHLLALTDGVSDDFAPAADHLWRLERPLFTSALAPGHTPVEAAAALCDLLGYERAGSFDDRTLVCVYRRSAAP